MCHDLRCRITLIKRVEAYRERRLFRVVRQRMMCKQILYLLIILTQFFLDMNNGRFKELADSL